MSKECLHTNSIRKKVPIFSFDLYRSASVLVVAAAAVLWQARLWAHLEQNCQLSQPTPNVYTFGRIDSTEAGEQYARHVSMPRQLR